MCNLEQLTFTCGHIQLTLLSSCDSAFRRKSTPEIYPLDRCRAGVHITNHTISQVACKADCRRKEALIDIERRYALAKARLNALLERVQKVDNCLTKTETKNFLIAKSRRFDKLEKEGWDAEKLAELCEAALHTLRQLLHEFLTHKSRAERDLEGAYAASKTSVKDQQVTTLDGTKMEMIAFDVSEVTELRNGAQLYDCVCEIERRASEAYFEYVGWELPKEDQLQCEVLNELGAWKRGFLSGSGMDDAWVGKPVKIVYIL